MIMNRNQMIIICFGTLFKSSLVYSSSFLPSPGIILTRPFCTVECSLAQLSADIDYIYKDLADDDFCISRYRLAVINQKINSGLYVLNPISVKYIKKEDLARFLYDTLQYSPDIMIGRIKDTETVFAAVQDPEDTLVSMGLSRMLLRLSYGSLPEEGYRLENLAGYFYYSLKLMGKVDRLYKLDLGSSFSKIPKSLVLEKVKLYVGEGSI